MDAISAITGSEFYRVATAKLAAEHDRLVEDIIRLTEIASPHYGEDARGAAYPRASSP